MTTTATTSSSSSSMLLLCGGSSTHFNRSSGSGSSNLSISDYISAKLRHHLLQKKKTRRVGFHLVNTNHRKDENEDVDENVEEDVDVNSIRRSSNDRRRFDVVRRDEDDSEGMNDVQNIAQDVRCSVVEIMRIPDDCRSNYWYNREEYARIRNDCEQEARRAMSVATTTVHNAKNKNNNQLQQQQQQQHHHQVQQQTADKLSSVAVVPVQIPTPPASPSSVVVDSLNNFHSNELNNDDDVGGGNENGTNHFACDFDKQQQEEEEELATDSRMLLSARSTTNIDHDNSCGGSIMDSCGGIGSTGGSTMSGCAFTEFMSLESCLNHLGDSDRDGDHDYHHRSHHQPQEKTPSLDYYAKNKTETGPSLFDYSAIPMNNNSNNVTATPTPTTIVANSTMIPRGLESYFATFDYYYYYSGGSAGGGGDGGRNSVSTTTTTCSNSTKYPSSLSFRPCSLLQRRKQSVYRVLDEQEFQRGVMYTSPDDIADVYMDASRRSKYEARYRARLDEMEVFGER